ncbi:MAG: DNA mismatch repair protein MutS [Gammaproteobacteria bacterium]|nr:DNA mismatch repair protein MutS [Gammaproteobacteria bacterium]
MTKKKIHSGKNVSKEDTSLFREMMQDVTPLPQDKIEPPQPKSQPKCDSALTPLEPRPLSRFIEMAYLAEISADETLFFSQSGLQQKRLDKLKHGQCSINGKIDLHGMSIAQAGERLHQFLKTAKTQQWRTILLIHGRGKGSFANKPVIKQHVNQWLRDTPEVLAFCSAIQRDGGTGALYVLLKRQRDAA